MIMDRLDGRRKNTAPFPVLALTVPTALAVVAAGLWFVSMPGQMTKRLSAVEASAAAIKAANTAGGDLKIFPSGTVCTGGSVDGLKSQLRGVFDKSGLQVLGFDIVDIGPAGAGGLEAYRVSFKGTGDYATAVNALDALNRHKPRFFLDSLALRNQVSSVQLELAGRVFCR